jgi:hypothetical protein
MPEVKASPTAAAPPKTEASPEAESPGVKASRPKAGVLDKANVFFAVFGVIAVVAGLLSHALLLIILIGLAFVGSLIVIAIYEKSIKWSAWRVIIALTLMSGILLFIEYVPPKTEAFQIAIPYDWLGWDITNPPLDYFPVSDDPATGHQYGNFTLYPNSNYNVNAACWTAGRLPRAPHTTVDWVSIKGGSFDGLWIPLDALGMDNPGLARDLPNCDSWWLKVWPF